MSREFLIFIPVAWFSIKQSSSRHTVGQQLLVKPLYHPDLSSTMCTSLTLSLLTYTVHTIPPDAVRLHTYICNAYTYTIEVGLVCL